LISHRWRGRNRQALSGFTDEEVDTLVALVKRLNQNLDTIACDPTAG
jgi:hypothetical protein